MACASQNGSNRKKGDMAFLDVRLATKASSTKLAVLRNKKRNEMKDCFEVMSG